MAKSITENLDAALSYARKGFHVFPLFYVLKDGTCSCRKAKCSRIGKHPTTKNGVQDATTDEATIKQWWTEKPYSNIGLATGHGGLTVMDVDDGPKRDRTGAVVTKDGIVVMKVGSESLTKLTGANEPLPDTLTIQSGNGGRHYYFRSIHPIKNSESKIEPDIDIRGVGGYVILPPSNHVSGGHYSVLSNAKITDMPPWLEKLCMKELDISQDSLQPEIAEDAKKKETKLSGEQLIRLLDFIPPDCDRETWWRVGAALKRELGDKAGYKAWDEWSQKAPDKYDPKVMPVQWASFTDKGVTGGTIFHFAKEHGFRGFDTEAADSPEIVDNWVYATSIKRFVHIKRFLEWDVEQFNANFARLFTRGRPSEHVLRNPAFRLLDGVTYWPEQPLYVEEDGLQKLNYWRRCDVTPGEGDVKPFLDHVRYLFPVPEGSEPGELSEEARILIQYLAYQVQYPGEKVHWALLLEGEQGNGKSYFGVVMRLVLGKHNVKMVHNDQLHETFTQWQRNTQLIVVEEMMARQRLELMNKLKPMITESWCMIREMYRPPYEQPNRFNFLFFSNHPDSLILDSTDRRYCILKTGRPPHPDRNAYYGPLFDWTRKHAAWLLHYLKYEVSLVGFLPKAHAPDTAGKRAMIERSMLPLDAFLYEHEQAGEYPMANDLVSTSNLVKPLGEFNLRLNPKQIAEAFVRLKYTSLGQVVGGGNKYRLWAVRNGDSYLEMTGPQVVGVYVNQQNMRNPTEAYMVSDGDADLIYRNRPRNPVLDRKPM